MLDHGLLKSFLSQFDREQRVAVTIRILADNVSNKYLNWYNLYLVPLFIEAFREHGFEYNPVDMELKMRNMVSMMRKTEYISERWKETGLKQVNELNNDEMRAYIDQLIIEAVEMQINVELPY